MSDHIEEQLETAPAYPRAPYEHRDEATAWRGGCWSARHGIPKRGNPYLSGTQGHSAWLAGWLAESHQEGVRE